MFTSSIHFPNSTPAELFAKTKLDDPVTRQNKDLAEKFLHKWKKYSHKKERGELFYLVPTEVEDIGFWEIVWIHTIDTGESSFEKLILPSLQAKTRRFANLNPGYTYVLLPATDNQNQAATIGAHWVIIKKITTIR